MPSFFTKKRVRDEAIIKRWRSHDDAVFARAGIPRERLEALQAALQGHIVLPNDPQYNADRALFNPAFNDSPLAIMYCVVENDVRICLQTAFALDLGFTIRSGGHSTAGYSASNGTILIDVSGLDAVVVDAQGLTATAGCGTTFAILNAALDEYGLHVPGGECDDVCVGGYMQGGGIGFTSRTFGMNCDNVIEVRVMLAFGLIVVANEKVNSDLWWAVRGGTGGNFGVLLTVKYRLRPLADVFGWAVAWPLSGSPDAVTNAAAALVELQTNYMLTAPPELNPQVMICYQPDAPGSQTMSPWLLVRGMYVGTAADGTAAIAGLVATAGAQLGTTGMGSYTSLNNSLLSVPYPIPALPGNSWLPEDKQARYVSAVLTAAQWEGILQFFLTTPNEYSYMCLEIYGGVINEYPLDASAFIHRTSAFSAFLDVFWTTPSEQPQAENFLAEWCAVMQPYWNGEIYQNYPSPNVPDYRMNYWGSAFDSLLAVKAKYDPTGIFTFPQAIVAAEGAPASRSPMPPLVAAALAKPIQYAPGARRGFSEPV